MKKLLIALGMTFIVGTTSACFKSKQCCKRNIDNNLECVTTCSYDVCPVDYSIEIK